MNERACGVRLHPAARLLRWMGRHAVGMGFLLIGVWLFRAVLAGADGISYDWQWYRVWRYLGRWTDGHFIPGPLLDGLGMTVRIALSGLALAVAAGLGADQTAAAAFTSITLIGCSVLFTGLGWYEKIAKHAGAGTLVPITGFANAVSCCAIESRAEGWILGVGAKIFTIAGPVIVYGTAASMLYGLIYYLATLGNR